MIRLLSLIVFLAGLLLGDSSGQWRVTWQGRLGSEQASLTMNQEGSKVTGTFQDVHGVSPVSGTIREKQITFDVQFGGSRPFTIRFAGTIDNSKIEGTSQAQGVGGSGAYLGHAGEIVQPQHPWTATLVTANTKE